MAEKDLGERLSSRGRIMFVAVLSGIAAIGLWGHQTHWKFYGRSPGKQAPVRKSLAMASAAGKSGLTEQPGLLELRSDAAAQKSGIDFAAAAERPMLAEVTANGIVTYDRTRLAQLSARVVGTVWRVEKQVGQPIKKGDVLAIIDAQEVGRVKAEFLQAIVSERLKAATLERLKQAGSAVAERAVREAEAAQQEARIRLFNAQQTLVNLGLPVRLEDVANLYDVELSQRIHFLGLPDSIVRGLDPVITTANLVPLIAPFDGVVIGQTVSLGERVDTDDPHHFEIADVSRMWINLEVRREDSAKVKLGQEVVFTVDGAPEQLRSTISWISTQVDEKTRMLEVRAVVDNPIVHSDEGDQDVQRLLHSNSFGTGRILIQRKQTALVVPAQAIQRDGVQPIVFLRVDDRTFEPRPVKIGLSDTSFTEIVEGLQLGNTVATDGSHVLKSEVLRIRMASGGVP